MIRFEMIFVIIAGIFLGTLILQENTTTLTTSDDLQLTQEGLDALSIANFYLDQMKCPPLAFDNYLVSSAVSPTDDPLAKLALLGSVGKEAGETTQPTFNDVDDWNGVDTVVSILNAGSFHVHCTVSYCDSMGHPTLQHKWTKLATVTVTDTVIGNPTQTSMRLPGAAGNQKMTIRKSAVVSYFKFLD